MKYREQRGSLGESMATIVDVESLADVRKLYEKTDLFVIDELTCKYYCYDKRIDWDTWVVLADGLPIGFSNGELK